MPQDLFRVKFSLSTDTVKKLGTSPTGCSEKIIYFSQLKFIARSINKK